MKLLLSLALLILPLSGCFRYPLVVGSQWTGEYTCLQGRTDLQLNIIGKHGSALDAVFIFDHRPSGANGRFFLKGNFDTETGSLLFEPQEWIERPACYVTVGMQGKILKDPIRFEGQITNPTCGAFQVNLVQPAASK